MKTSYVVFSVLLVIGVFASLALGEMKLVNKVQIFDPAKMADPNQVVGENETTTSSAQKEEVLSRQTTEERIVPSQPNITEAESVQDPCVLPAEPAWKVKKGIPGRPAAMSQDFAPSPEHFAQDPRMERTRQVPPLPRHDRKGTANLEGDMILEGLRTSHKTSHAPRRSSSLRRMNPGRIGYSQSLPQPARDPNSDVDLKLPAKIPN